MRLVKCICLFMAKKIGYSWGSMFLISDFWFQVSEVSCFVVPPRSDGADSGFQEFQCFRFLVSGFRGFLLRRSSSQ